MSKIKTLIVDDETSTIESLKSYISNIESVEICGIATNGEEAINMIEKLKPQIVLLDIELPKLNGFQVINKVSGVDEICWIFVTEYNKYAVKAFEANVIDYLLKPVKKQRFIKAVTRTLNYLNKFVKNDPKTISSTDKTNGEEDLKKILVKDAKSYLLIDVEDIYYFEASGNYVKIHLRNKHYMVRTTLKNLDKKLNSRQFYRIHKSTIVNIDFVSGFEQWFTGDYEVHLKNGEKLRLSRNYKEILENFQ